MSLADANLISALDIMFTDPKHQRRGVGTKLLMWGMRADEMGIEIPLEATQFERHMYEQNRFQVTEIQVLDKWAYKPTLQ